jgi:N-acetyl-gamma-glutamyl-phosphate reductase
VFVPHLLPTPRGILATLTVSFMRRISVEEMNAAYEKAYANAPLVTVHPHGQMPELRSVVNTPRAEIGYQRINDGDGAVVVSVIDNLLKGAASQAVQNFNRMCGFAETEALA